jgi:hypothetical protein
VCGNHELRSKNYLRLFGVQRFSVSDEDVEFNAKEGVVFRDP